MVCVTVVVVGISAGWCIVDSIRLRKAFRDRTHQRHDRIFGSFVGLICGAIGVAGAIMYNS
jgi:hypothetical protein